MSNIFIKITGFIDGLPLSRQYLSSTSSYTKFKSNIASTLRYKLLLETNSKIEIILH